MNNIETIINIRKDIVGELDAINQYQQHILQTTDEKAKRVWTSIIHEEQTHVGELFSLLFQLDPTSKEYFEKGMKETSTQNIAKRPFQF